MTTTFGDLLILRWSRLEIPWKSFSLGVFFIHFWYFPMFLVRSLASGRIPFHQFASRLRERPDGLEFLESKCERNRSFAWSLLIPFALIPVWFLWNASQRYIAALSTPVVYWGKGWQNWQIYRFIPSVTSSPTHIRRVPLQAETSHQHQKELKHCLGKVQTTK